MEYNGRFRSWIIIRLFIGIMMDFGWEKLLRMIRGTAVVEARRPEMFRRQAVLIRETAIRLGGVLIKLGQFFSTRVDLLPKEYTEELSKLQDEVTPFDVEKVYKIIEEELGKQVEQLFSKFDRKEHAAASLGQVHLAELPGGEQVAVKILRPRIEEIIAVDLKTLQRVITMIELFTEWGKRFDLWAIYKEFSRVLLAELDYILEGQNGERFLNSFASEPRVKIPSIYWSHTTRRVLTMEYVKGDKITDVSLWREYVAPEKVVEIVVDAYMKQVLDLGVFHADPHPGNIMVLADGRLGLIDFGMVGSVSAKDKEYLRQLVLAVGSKNSPGIVKAFGDLGFLRPDTDQVVIRRAFDQIIEKFGNLPIGEISNEKWMQIMDDLEEVVREEPFQIPSNFIFLGRTVGTLFGICVALEPEANFMAILEPHLKRLAMTDSLEGEKISYIEQAMSFGATVVEIPRRLQRTLTLAEEGRLHMIVDTPNLNRLLKAQEKSSRYLARSVIFAALMIASTILYVNGFRLEAHINFGLAVLIFMYLVFTWRGGVKK